jgi:kynureninase
MTISTLAQHYHRPEGIYALSHSVGPLCKDAEIALKAHYLNPWQHCAGDAWPQWLSQIEAFTQALSVLLNVNQSELCPQPSVSLGFSQWLAASAKNRKDGKRRTVIMHEEAFASLGFAVKGLCDTYSLTLELVSFAPNDLDAWEQALRENSVFAALITHAHSNTGELSNVKDISKIAQRNNVLCAVDIAQSVGIIPIDIQTWSVDCVVGSCVKWLSGGPGAGFLYVPSNKVEDLAPDHVAWFSHENPFEFDIRHFKAANNALKFWGGTPDIAPFCMAAAAINVHLSVGTQVIRAHNVSLMQRFVANYQGIIPSHYQQDEFTGSLCLPLESNAKSTIESAFQQHKIKHDFRKNVVRLSFGIINSYNEVDKVLSVFE